MRKKSFTELRLQRLRHGITAGQVSKRLGVSVSWVYDLEKGRYRGGCNESWRSRYELVLRELIEERKHERTMLRV